MGRLTDDLLAMFGIKPSDRVSFPSRQSHPQDSPPFPANKTDTEREANSAETLIAPVRPEQKKSGYSALLSFREEVTSNSKRHHESSPVSTEQSPTVTPRRPEESNQSVNLDPVVASREVDKNCFSCKVIGTGTCIVGGIMIIFMTYRSHHLYPGRWEKKALFLNSVVSPCMLFYIGICRALDYGMYDPKRRLMTVTDHLNFESMEWCQWLNIPPPSSVQLWAKHNEDFLKKNYSQPPDLSK